MLWLAAVDAADNVHNILLKRILQNPMHFYESIPTGRIITRLSKDIESIDDELPFNVYEVIESTCLVRDI